MATRNHPTSPASPATLVDAWLEVAETPDGVVATVTQALGDLGVSLHPRVGSGTPGSGRGVVVFRDITATVLDLVQEVTRQGVDLVLALSTAPDLDAKDTWSLLEAGAADVLSSSGGADVLSRVAARLRRWQDVDELLGSRLVRESLVGDSRTWRNVLRQVVEIARFTDASVLVTGQSGTGKEQVARLIHELDPHRHRKELVVLDCSTVVPSLSGSEFFGHEKGAFTGAAAARAGAFELADGGTLFLDEVGELPPVLQAELLRVIQEGTFKRVGSNVWRSSDFRLVCATNRDLCEERATGAFRHDFYYRIAECTVELPSLAERRDDIVPLFRHFFHQLHPDRDPPELEGAVQDLLVSRDYPGNVRDLRSLVLRIAHRHLGDRYVTVGDVPDQDRPTAPTVPWPDRRFEDSILTALGKGLGLEEVISAATDTATRLARTYARRDAAT